MLPRSYTQRLFVALAALLAFTACGGGLYHDQAAELAKYSNPIETLAVPTPTKFIQRRTLPNNILPFAKAQKEAKAQVSKEVDGYSLSFVYPTPKGTNHSEHCYGECLILDTTGVELLTIHSDRKELNGKHYFSISWEQLSRLRAGKIPLVFSISLTKNNRKDTFHTLAIQHDFQVPAISRSAAQLEHILANNSRADYNNLQGIGAGTDLGLRIEGVAPRTSLYYHIYTFNLPSNKGEHRYSYHETFYFPADTEQLYVAASELDVFKSHSYGGWLLPARALTKDTSVEWTSSDIRRLKLNFKKIEAVNH